MATLRQGSTEASTGTHRCKYQGFRFARRKLEHEIDRKIAHDRRLGKPVGKPRNAPISGRKALLQSAGRTDTRGLRPAARTAIRLYREANQG